MSVRDIPLVVFAKVPQPGKVKTRLLRCCSAVQATVIAEILLRETVRNVSLNWPGKVYIASWPTTDNPLIQELAKQYGLSVILQHEGDLGQKMFATFEQLKYPAAIIGSDAPTVTADNLIQAHQQLANGNDVLGPATDGGYYLIGLTAPQANLFTDIAWGTERVLQQTRTRHSFAMLEPLTDIDLWEDVIELSQRLPSLKTFLQSERLI